MNQNFRNLMTDGLKDLPIDLDEKQFCQFEQFYQDLIEKNKVMNLTAITELKEVICKHFIDSLEIIRAVPDIREKPYKIIDLGTGAGFPGIPAAIAWPNLELFLLDSLNKRILFIEEEAEKLGLINLKAAHGRAEDFGRDPKFREQYDLCVSRAVANLSTLSEYCLPFIHKGGYFIPYKSGTADQELQSAKHALTLLGGRKKDFIRFTLPDDDGARTLILIEKITPTPNKYPRKAGLPQKEPLQ